MRIKLLGIAVGLVLLVSNIGAGEAGKTYLTDDGKEYSIESEQIIDNFEGAELTNWKTSLAGEGEPKGVIDISLNKDKRYLREGNQSLKISFQKNKSEFAWVRLYGIAQGDAAKYNALGFYLYVPDKNLSDFRVYLYYAPRGDMAGTYNLKNLSPGGHYCIIPKESFTGITDESWGNLCMLFFLVNGENSTAYVDNLYFLKIKKTSEKIVIDNFESETEDIGNWACDSMVWKENKGQAAEKSLAKISLNKDVKYVKNGQKSLQVTINPSEAKGEYAILRNPRIPSPSPETDAITFWIYSREGGGKFSLDLFTPSWDAFHASSSIDFVGWKKFVIPRDKMIAKKDIEWTKISYLQFILFGNFTVYLDDMAFESSKTAQEVIEQPGKKPKEEDITPKE